MPLLQQVTSRSTLSEGVPRPRMTRGPKISAIHHASTLGGGSISFLDVLEMLREDYEITATCPIAPDTLARSLKSNGFDYVPSPMPLPFFNHYNGGSQLLSRTFCAGLRNYSTFRGRWAQYIQAQAPDLVIVNSAVMVLMGPIIRKTGAKSLCFVRETFPSKNGSLRTRILYRLLDRNFDGVLFLSKHDQRVAGLTRAKTAVVRDCARPGTYLAQTRKEACSELGIPVESFNILYTGGASWIKGLDIALRSLSRLDSIDIRLLVVGNMTSANIRTRPGELLSWILNPRQTFSVRSVKKLLIAWEMSDRLVVLGTQTDMARCYSAADVVIFPSNLPHQARPIFEAGLYSLPVILSDYPETREYLEHDLNGLTFKPRSAKGLARAIAELHKDRAKARRLGEMNRVMALQRHGFEVEKDRLLAFVHDLLSNG